MHNKECSLDAGVAGVIAMDAGIDPQLAVEAGADAQDLLSFIRDAARAKGDKAKAKYLRKAQVHLKDVNARQHPDLVQAVQARILALRGRGGDTELAHVTPGEMVLPAPLQTPEVMAAVQAAAQNAGIEVGQYTVGAQANSVNPETGMAEYFSNSVSQGASDEVDEIVVRGRRPGGGFTSVPVNHFTQITHVPNSGGSPLFNDIGNFELPPNDPCSRLVSEGGLSPEQAASHDFCQEGNRPKRFTLPSPAPRYPSDADLEGMSDEELEGKIKTLQWLDRGFGSFPLPGPYLKSLKNELGDEYDFVIDRYQTEFNRRGQ